MDLAFELLKQTLLVLMDVLSFAFLLCSILSWIDPMRQWKISAFLAMITEPLIMPIRKLCYKNHWFEGTPLDMPFMIAFLLLLVLQTMISFL